jgi:long-chain acyl-CoA synthetase
MPQLTDEALAEILRIIPLGLRSVYSSLRKATPESPSSILILLPPSRTASLPLLLLALKAPPNCPLIILPTPHLLTAALTAKEHPNPGVIVVHESLAEDVIEQAWEDLSGTCGVCIFGDPDKMRKGAVMAAKKKGMDVAWWADLWDAGDEAKREELPCEWEASAVDRD